jgi:hypothetical protein
MKQHPFAYVASVAAKYGIDKIRWKHKCEAFVDSMSADELAELAEIYHEMERREDALPISRWIKEKVDDGLTCERKQMTNLFALFYGLAVQGIAPFSSQRVGYTEVAKPLDWSKLPKDLNYLEAPAKKYGVYQFADHVEAFWRRATPGEVAELEELNKRTLRDSDKITLFLRQFRITEHREAALVYFLIGLLDALSSV